MFAPLLTTKYHLPPAALERVVRLRLFSRLDELLLPGKRLALVSALAGSGKTTLVRAWVEQGIQPDLTGRNLLSGVAWLSLDEEDNDLATFLAYLIAALKTACPMIDPEPIAPHETGSLFTPPPVRSILAGVVNRLAVLQGHVVLVLDDYHVISSPAVHEAVTFLLDHLPDCVRLVIATRAELLLPVSRLRARGQLVEIREADLRFTTAESAAFLNETMGLQVKPADLELLVERTEGWAVGLQMAALALRSLPDSAIQTGNFVRTFSGSNRFVLDYLMDEVFSSLPARTRSFLLDTAILDRFCAELCEAVIGGPASGEASAETTDGGEPETVERMLASLSQANLFIIPLDEERCWYRYHHLFAELLRSRLRQEATPQEIAERQRRAGAWFAARRLTPEAIHYDLLAGDFEQASSLVETCTQEVISNGRLTLLSQWLAGLPAGVLARRPRLRIFQALVSFLKGDQSSAVKILEETSQALQGLPETDNTQALKRELLSILAMSRMTGPDSKRVLALAQEALDSMPETELIPRARLLFAQGLSYAMSSDRRYYTLIQQAMDLARQAGDLYLVANILNLQAMGAIFFQARYHTAWQLYNEIIGICSPVGGELLPLPAAFGYLGQAAIAVEWNNLEQALDLLDKGEKLCRQGGQTGSSSSALLIQARLAQARGNFARAAEALDEAASARAFDDNIAAVAQLAQAQVRLYLSAGQIEKAAHYAAGEGLPPESRPSQDLPALVQEVWSVLQTRVLLAQGQPEQALSLLGEIIPQAEKGGRMARVIEGSLYQALALQALRGEALEPLRRALAVGQPQGITRLYLEAGQPVLDLLTANRSRLGEYSTDAQRLLDLLSGPKAAPALRATALVEPLTAREMDVLRLLCEGQSNQQIASTLFLSLSAVKKYTGNLYGKLGITSRAQAIIRANELKLV